MKRLIACMLSLLLCCGCALPAAAEQMDQLPENRGGSEYMLVVALIIVLAGGIYLFFKLKKEH